MPVTDCLAVQRMRENHMMKPQPAFALHPRLTADTLPLGEMGLSRLLLMNDARFTWLILVPRRADVREIIDLELADQVTLFAEMTAVSRALQQAFAPDKLNIGVLGNMVPQLHVHIVARFIGDAAWPKPVWGAGVAEPHAGVAAREVAERLRAAGLDFAAN